MSGTESADIAEARAAYQEYKKQFAASTSPSKSPGDIYTNELLSGSKMLEDVGNAASAIGTVVRHPIQSAKNIGIGLAEGLGREAKKPIRDIINDVGRTSASLIPGGGIIYDAANVALGNESMNTPEEARALAERHRGEGLMAVLGAAVPAAAKGVTKGANVALNNEARMMRVLGASDKALNEFGQQQVQRAAKTLITNHPDIADRIFGTGSVRKAAQIGRDELQKAGSAIGSFYDKYKQIFVPAQEIENAGPIRELLDSATSPAKYGAEARAAASALREIPEAISPLNKAATGLDVKGLHDAMVSADKVVSKSVYGKEMAADVALKGAADAQVADGIREALYKIVDDAAAAGQILPDDYAAFVKNRDIYRNLTGIEEVLVKQSSKKIGKIPFFDEKVGINTLTSGLGAYGLYNIGGPGALALGGGVAALSSNPGRALVYNAGKLEQMMGWDIPIKTGVLAGVVAANPPKISRDGSKVTEGDVNTIVQKLPPEEAQQVVAQLYPALKNGNSQEKNLALGSLAGTFPEVRDSFEPTKTYAQSEMGGLVADPQDKVNLKRRMIAAVKSANATGSNMPLIDRARFASNLNSDTPFTRVPEELQATDNVTSLIDEVLPSTSSGGYGPSY